MSPPLPSSPRLKVPHIDDVSALIVSAVTLKTYDSAVNSNSVVTSGNWTITLLALETVSVMVKDWSVQASQLLSRYH